MTNLCEGCAEAIAPLVRSAIKQATVDAAFFYTIQPLWKLVPESECEFWAHKKLNRMLEEVAAL